MDKVKPYIRASAKQLEYIASLCEQTGSVNRSLYQKYSMNMANKEISKLQRLLAKQRRKERQTALF